MKAYFLRRLLLIPFTLIGVTLAVFTTIRLAPGGPVEQALAKLIGGEQKRSKAEAGLSLTAAQVLALEENYNRDKNLFTAYLEWLGVRPRDIAKFGKEFPVEKIDPSATIDPDQAVTMEMPVPGTVYLAKITRRGDKVSMELPKEADPHWQVRLRSPKEQAARWAKWVPGTPLAKAPGYRAVMFYPGYDGLLQGSLQDSWKYQDSVWSMIRARLPISIFFGVASMIVVYGICLPLGIVKAIRHRSFLDNWTSVAVFAGYAVPGYALGSLMVVFLGAKLGWFPIRGFTSDNFETLSLGRQIADLLDHTFMPMICYFVGSFAFMTMMMKNSLMDNLAADYVRTAAAKGVSFPSAVFRHAFRNSIIPIATTFGANITLLVGGSMLVEKVFDINGFGLLQFNAILERDEPLIMGVIFLSSFLMLVGNVLSDLCVQLVDPRVSYK